MLAELEAVIDCCGGFARIEDFGVVVDAPQPWIYDMESRSLSLDMAKVRVVWRTARTHLRSSPTATAAVLLLSGDVYTAWNERKRHIGADDLAFNAVVLRRHAKAASAWAHRKWCLANTAYDARRELDLCHTLTTRFPRNYAAWTHRTWVLDRHPALVENDLARVRQHLETKVTDYSAMHVALRAARTLHRLTDLDDLALHLATVYPHLAQSQVGALAYFQRLLALLLHRRRPDAPVIDAWLDLHNSASSTRSRAAASAPS